jgi:two-component system, NarL family, nitrate/nitrite sensor histidine kinase NarX
VIASTRLSTRLTRIGASLLIVALASIGLTLWVTWKLEGGAAAVNEAGRMRMQTWRLVALARSGAAPAEVAQLVEEFDASLRLLASGDSARPLFVPWDDNVHERFGRVQELWRVHRAGWVSGEKAEGAGNREAATRYVAAIDDFVDAIEHRLSSYTAILNLFQVLMMVLAVLGAVIMLYTGYQFVINPLARLKTGLADIEAGKFGARIDVETRDEFGEVAAGFNRMAQRLAQLYEGLEAQVRAKTRHVEAQHERLTTLYEVSAFLGAAGDLDSLAKGFATKVREAMKADACAVRWHDEDHGQYLMLTAEGLPPEIVEAERCLATGACECGVNEAEPRIRVVPIRPLDAATEMPCVAAGFATVVTVPVRLQSRTLGEIDLFYRQEVHPSAEARALLDALASHLASAVEGLRAAALEREAAVGEERALIARELHDSIAQSLAFMKIQVQLLRQAVQKGQADAVQRTLQELDTGLQEGVADVRELLLHFRTRSSDQDLEQALRMTLKKFENQSGVPAEIRVTGSGLPPPPDVQVQVLHVIQEALSNVRKHARADHVAVELHKGPHWTIRVIDDGAGFDVANQPLETHVGLHIMRERAQRIGATVTVSSALGQGTVVTLTLPGTTVGS